MAASFSHDSMEPIDELETMANGAGTPKNEDLRCLTAASFNKPMTR